MNLPRGSKRRRNVPTSAGFDAFPERCQPLRVETMDTGDSKKPGRKPVPSTDDALTRELREAAKFLLDFYLWRSRGKDEGSKRSFDDSQ